MTVDLPGNLPAMTEADFEDFDGLDDFDSSRMVVPEIRIGHRDQRFTSPWDRAELWGSELHTVLLAVAKQRSLWKPRYDGVKDLPICRSNDGKNGFVTPLELRKDKTKIFPWSEAELDPSEYQELPDGSYHLDCNICNLKEWDTHPLGVKPYCGQTYKFVMLVCDPDGDRRDFGSYFPCLFTVKGVGIRPAELYLTEFKATRKPLWVRGTLLNLVPATKGDSEYAQIRFSRGEPTDSSFHEDWKYLALTTLKAIKARPASDVDPDSVEVKIPSNSTTTPPRPAPRPAPVVSPAPAAAATVVDAEEEYPF